MCFPSMKVYIVDESGTQKMLPLTVLHPQCSQQAAEQRKLETAIPKQTATVPGRPQILILRMHSRTRKEEVHHEKIAKPSAA